MSHSAPVAPELLTVIETAPAAVQALPLRWRPGAAFSAVDAADAQRVLAAVAALDERPPVACEDGGLEAEVARLHQKMQLLMEMVGGLLRAQQPVPPALPVRLVAGGLRWSDRQKPVGDRGLVELWLHSACPEPLCLPVRLLMIQAEPGGVRIDAAFEELPETLAAALEKHVFLRHRRELAEARQLRR